MVAQMEAGRYLFLADAAIALVLAAIVLATLADELGLTAREALDIAREARPA